MADLSLRAKVAGFLRKAAVALASAILFWTLVIMLFEEKFIFFPSAYPAGPYDELRFIPNHREVEFITTDGLRLHGVYVPADSAVATILFSHGNAGNLSHRVHWMRAMAPLRANIFLYDYRGYGKSEGTPDETGVYLDAVAAYDHLKRSLGTQGTPVVLWGRSLGGAVSVELATKRRADALILESTFTSAKDMASEVYPILPFIGSLVRTEFDSESKLRRLPLPSLHIHGNEDEIVPISLGRKLFDAALGPKEFYSIEGAGHYDAYIIGGSTYIKKVRTFLRSLSGRTHPGSD